MKISYYCLSYNKNNSFSFKNFEKIYNLECNSVKKSPIFTWKTYIVQSSMKFFDQKHNTILKAVSVGEILNLRYQCLIIRQRILPNYTRLWSILCNQKVVYNYTYIVKYDWTFDGIFLLVSNISFNFVIKFVLVTKC